MDGHDVALFLILEDLEVEQRVDPERLERKRDVDGARGVRDGVNAREFGLERRQSQLIGLRLVHGGRPEIADLLFIAACRRPALRGRTLADRAQFGIQVVLH